MSGNPNHRIAKPYGPWTVDTERAFLVALKLTGQPTKAVKEIGRGITAAYTRRKRDPAFAAAWDAAVAEGQAEWAALAAERRGAIDDKAGGGRLVRARERADGWNARRRGAFLKELATSKDVRAACEAAGMSSTSAYDLRMRAPRFAKAWEKALLESAPPSVMAAAMERAVNGWVEPIVAGGRIVGERRRYSDSLLKTLVDQEGRKAGPGKEPPRARTQKARVEQAEAAAEAAGGTFVDRRIPREEAEEKLHALLDVLALEEERADREEHAAAWVRWQADWSKWGRQQPRRLLLADLRADAGVTLES